MKRPSFQFYPSDWLRDTALRSCSIGARGLWIDMLCFMHEGYPYGHLKVKNKVILPANLSRMVGEALEVVEGWLDELLSAGVCEVDSDGAFFSKRMVKDENIRLARAAGGIKGGNPNLKKSKVNLDSNLNQENKDKQNTTPSSSSSSSLNTTTTLPHTRPETVDNYPQPKPPRFYLKSDWVVEKTDQRVVSAARLINIAVDDISDHAFNQALLAFRGMSAQREFNDELAAINVFCAKYLRSALLKPSKQPIEQPTRELTREERRAIQDKKYENDEANFNRGRWDKKNNEGDQNV